MSKVILVTGTSSGLGMSLACKLASLGHTVYASMRDTAKKEQLLSICESKQVALNIVKLDVCSDESVAACIKKILDKHGHIDCLINNAGMGFIKTIEQASMQEMQEVLDVNFYGVIRTMKAVIPGMRKRRSGHIINISSVGGLVGQPFNEVYCASKFAVEGVTESMATYLQPSFNIKFSIVEPGGISSEFANNVLKRFNPLEQDKQDEYLPLLKQYIGNAEKRSLDSESDSVYQSADEVASCIIEVFNSDMPPLRVRTSEWAKRFCELKTAADPSGLKLVNKVFDEMLA
jgi:short-subunit dehydrogenase